MRIKIDGQDFTGFISATASRHFLDLSGHFSFVASPLTKGLEFPLKVQQECQIIIEETPFITGFIEEISVESSAYDEQIVVSGRDRTGDVIDSRVDFTVLSVFKGSVTLKHVCETILKNLNISNIQVIDLVNPAPFELGDYVAASIGESAFEFLQKFSKKRQVLLTTDGLGNIVITRAVDAISNPVSLPTKIISVRDNKNENNNVVSSRFKISTKDQYRFYKCYSQLAVSLLAFANDTGGAGSGVLADKATSQTGIITNDEIRAGRQLVFISDTPLDNENAVQRAIWEMNYRRSRDLHYACTVVGHTYDSKNIWQANRLVQIFDDTANITGANLLLDSVKFNESLDGLTTQLNFVDNLSYSLQTEKNYRQSLSEDIGNVFFKPST